MSMYSTNIKIKEVPCGVVMRGTIRVLDTSSIALKARTMDSSDLTEEARK